VKRTRGDPPAEAKAGNGGEIKGLDAVPMLPPTRGEFDSLRRECDELKDQLLRKRADFENYRKRVERDRQQASRDATAEVLKGLIPTVDALEQALSAGAKEGTLREGLELIYRNFLAALEERGLKVQDPLGTKFDPEIHQALSHESVEGVSEGTIVEVFRKGYFLGDRLLRPALVKVAKGREDSESIH
jgi:molecular chaperone GrpE